MTLGQILNVLRGMAPEETALEDDPVGLLIGGDLDAPVTKIGVCLDAMPETAQRAAQAGVQLLVAHHPLIYRPLRRINPAADPVGRAAALLVKGDVALYAMHTNWDRAPGGINDTLAAALELGNVRPLGADGAAALPRLGDLTPPRPLADFARFVDNALGCAGTSALRVNDVTGTKMVSRVAVCGGAGAFLAGDVLAAGADAYVTSDVRYHEFLDAAARGLPLLDAGHDATETPGMRALAHRLPQQLAGVEVVWVGGG
ncbi:MAG: Nif3-like dinuclear metal center hexameric protein [Armatimonadetes bacterium]|nr:Nif3-like dinuclear metal center hexameric protein [Armatimonadota bacterium]